MKRLALAFTALWLSPSLRAQVVVAPVAPSLPLPAVVVIEPCVIELPAPRPYEPAVPAELPGIEWKDPTVYRRLPGPATGGTPISLPAFPGARIVRRLPGPSVPSQPVQVRGSATAALLRMSTQFAAPIVTVAP